MMNYSCRWRAVTPLTTRGAETGIIKFFQEDSDLAHVVSSLSNGTELEVNFGKSLQVRLTATCYVIIHHLSLSRP